MKKNKPFIEPGEIKLNVNCFKAKKKKKSKRVTNFNDNAYK